MKLNRITVAIVLTALAVTLLPAPKANAQAWYNCMEVDITSPEDGDKFQTHDRIRVRWTAYYTGDNPYPYNPISYRIELRAPCGCLLYRVVGEYPSVSTYDLPWWADFKAVGSHNFLVPGFITAKYPNSTLSVESQRTPHGDWYYASISVDIKMIYDPLPIPIEDPGFTCSLSDSPTRDYLKDPYPNPFNPRTSIQFDLEETGDVTLKIYDVQGRLVKTLRDNENMPAGEYRESWKGLDNNGERVPSGVYFVRLTTGNGYSQTRKLVLLQ